MGKCPQLVACGAVMESSDVIFMSQTKRKKVIVGEAEGAPPPVLALPSDPGILLARLSDQIPSEQMGLALRSLSE